MGYFVFSNFFRGGPIQINKIFNEMSSVWLFIPTDLGTGGHEIRGSVLTILLKIGTENVFGPIKSVIDRTTRTFLTFHNY